MEKKSAKSIRDGIRLGLDRIVHEPMSDQLDELLRVLRAREQQARATNR